MLCLSARSTFAQQDSLTDYIYSRIVLDEVVVTASRDGTLDVRDFIRLVQSDLSFYRAFYNLRTISYRSETHMRFFNRKGKEKASYFVRNHQLSDGLCRSMQMEEEKHKGRFFTQKGSYVYYTAELYAYVFFTRDTVCVSAHPDAWRPAETHKLSGTNKHVEELKKVLFATGQPTDIPLSGKKMAIFSEKMIDRYNYAIQSDTLNERPCYLFSIQAKPDLAPSKTIIKKLDIWFERGSLQILRRKFHLYARTLPYDFDVNFDIHLTKENELYLPQSISYHGWWKVPTQKLEKAEIKVVFYDFQKKHSSSK